jgi:nitrate reductase delta subunit
MAHTFKVLSILLDYPTQEVQYAAPDLRRIIEDEGLVPSRLRSGLFKLIDDLAARDLFDIQERYVLLFDRTRSLSLYFFEHIHGESRDRGQAMVDLMALYERNGLSIGAKELPDYLPMFLEFLSTMPIDQAGALLAEPMHILEALADRHRKRKSVYAVVFRVLVDLAAGKADPDAVAALLEDPEDDPNDLEALDRIWEDEVVTFGPEAGGMISPDGSCPATREILHRMDAPTHTPKS